MVLKMRIFPFAELDFEKKKGGPAKKEQ